MGGSGPIGGRCELVVQRCREVRLPGLKTLDGFLTERRKKASSCRTMGRPVQSRAGGLSGGLSFGHMRFVRICPENETP